MCASEEKLVWGRGCGTAARRKGAWIAVKPPLTSVPGAGGNFVGTEFELCLLGKKVLALLIREEGADGWGHSLQRE